MIRFRLKVAVAALFILMTVNVSFGYNIYNFTDGTIEAWDDSTMLGGYSGTINPGSFGSCPGNDFGCGSNNDIAFCLYPSTFQATNCNSSSDSPFFYYCAISPYGGNMPNVPAHGWVEISGSSTASDCSQLTCKIFDNNGNSLYNGPCDDSNIQRPS